MTPDPMQAGFFAAVFADQALWLPLVFAVLMGVSILIYVVLDGFDLGVGALFLLAKPEDRNLMIGSIGPFWDANETWLVLAVGLLLTAFPIAHGAVLGALYLPVAILLIGLILRGVAFEFRAKAPLASRPKWDVCFAAGSLATTLAQGFMLGIYAVGLEFTPLTVAFGALTALCLTAGYAYIGAAWLILKTEGMLQRRAVLWAQASLIGLVAGFAAISLATPLASPRIYEKWFAWPEFALLAPLPILAGALTLALWRMLARMPYPGDRRAWGPFVGGMALFILAFLGLAYSFYPYVVPDRLTIFEAASAPESLLIILVGALVVLPAIVGYTALAYWVFRGKAKTLSYE